MDTTVAIAKQKIKIPTNRINNKKKNTKESEHTPQYLQTRGKHVANTFQSWLVQSNKK